MLKINKGSKFNRKLLPFFTLNAKRDYVQREREKYSNSYRIESAKRKVLSIPSDKFSKY